VENERKKGNTTEITIVEFLEIGGREEVKLKKKGGLRGRRWILGV